jgi:hypothetical protein
MGVGSTENGDVGINITNDLKSVESHYRDEIDINRQIETKDKQHVGIDNQHKMDQIKNNKCISIMRFKSRLKDDNQKKWPLG